MELVRVNNRGRVIGTSSLAADPGACLGIGDTANCHPFFWDDGRLIEGNPATTNKIATAAMEVSLTPREIAARIRGFARKSLFDHTASPIR